MEQAKLTIPYAIADFAELRERGYYYVDKTQYIFLLEQYKAPVFLKQHQGMCLRLQIPVMPSLRHRFLTGHGQKS